MEPDGIITSVWNNAIVFRPRTGEPGLLMITRRFDNDSLARKKEQDSPLGKRLLQEEGSVFLVLILFIAKNNGVLSKT
jgi:hypothetical protein